MSLLELVVAVSVFAVAFVMLLTVFPTAARAVRQGEQYLAATFLAERRLEEVRAMDFDGLDALNDPPSPPPVELTTNNQGISTAQSYSIQTSVSPTTSPDLRRVRVVVSWTADRARYVEVLTDVARLR